MVSMQGGPADLIDQPAKYLTMAPVVRALPATADGCVEYMDTRAIGLSIVNLGGGHKRIDDIIDHRVGLSDFAWWVIMLTRVIQLVVIHAANETDWQVAAETLLEAIVLGRSKDALPARL